MNYKEKTLGLGTSPIKATWTIGTEASDAIAVSAQFKDFNGNNLDGYRTAKFILWDSAAGVNARTIEVAADVSGAGAITVAPTGSTTTRLCRNSFATSDALVGDIVFEDGLVSLTITNKAGADQYILSIYMDGVEYSSDAIDFGA